MPYLDSNKSTAKTKYSKQSSSFAFPFTAIQYQDDLKLGLMLNLIDPEIRGMLIIGDRGTGKSTTIRALKAILPPIIRAQGDPFNRSPQFCSRQLNLGVISELGNLQNPSSSSSPSETNYAMMRIARWKLNGFKNLEVKKTPLIDLPLGATEDRICGTINLERAVTSGKRGFEPGLLANTHRGLLYVDEVNLLDDHLVDILLDAAASGSTIVEREGVSVKHPSKFILIGSGNPEEGEIRPQLLDRFGLYTEITTVQDPAKRLQIIEARTDYDKRAECWSHAYAQAESYLKEKVIRSRYLLQFVILPNKLRDAASQMCQTLNVDGLRADIVLCRSARALAAFQGQKRVTVEHFQRISQLCLRHRLRKDPLEVIDSGSKVDQIFEEHFGQLTD
jgi:magnesium chelatase subunit I